MGKADRLKGVANAISKRKSFLISFSGTFVALLGVSSAVFTIVGQHISPVSTLCFVAGALALSGIANRNRFRLVHLPVDGILSTPFDEIISKRIHCPCDLRLANQVGPVAHEFYGDDTLDPERYEQLRLKNPYILACLTDAQGEFLGYFDVIPMKDSFAEQFVKGTVTEKDMTHEDVMATDEMQRCQHVYLSGLASRDPSTQAGRLDACILVWALLKYLDRFYGLGSPNAFAVAVTPEGEHLLQKFKLSVVCEAARRRDKHAMYSMLLTHDEIVRRLECMPDYSGLCSLGWTSSDLPFSKAVRAHPRPNPTRAKLHCLPPTGTTHRTRV